MVLNKRNIFYFSVSFLTAVSVVLGSLLVNSYIIWLSILTIFATLVLYVVKNDDTTVVLGGFLVSFFTFMLGKYTCQIIFGNFDPGYNNSIFLRESISVYISLISLFLGYSFFRKKRILTAAIIGNEAIQKYLASVKLISIYARLLFLVAVSCSILVNLDIASRSFGLFYRAHSISSRLPFIVQKIAQMQAMFYWIYLSTLPTKEKTKYPSILFIMNTLLSISTGVRGIAVTNIMSVAMYYYFRHKNSKQLNDNTVWITKKMKIVTIVIVPIGIIALVLFSYIRIAERIDADKANAFALLQEFFVQQGGSVDIIGSVFSFKDRNLLPRSNISYTFGPIINFLKNSSFGAALGLGFETVSNVQNVSLATQGNNLGATITYLRARSYYLTGGGFGTCYIAELIADFGYAGVIIFNFLLGWLFNNMNYFMSKKWWINAWGMLVVRNILFMPRDFALGFIVSALSNTNILPILILMVINDFIRRNNARKVILCE